MIGADCCLKIKSKHRTDFVQGSREHIAWLKSNTIMHADGGNALASEATPVTLSAEIDSGTDDETIRPGHGRWWTTKPDRVLSAQWLLRMARMSEGRIRIIGDGLPNALALKTETYLRKLPNFVNAAGDVILIPWARES